MSNLHKALLYNLTNSFFVLNCYVKDTFHTESLEEREALSASQKICITCNENVMMVKREWRFMTERRQDSSKEIKVMNRSEEVFDRMAEWQ
jgi:hypothetical protein